MEEILVQHLDHEVAGRTDKLGPLDGGQDDRAGQRQEDGRGGGGLGEDAIERCLPTPRQ